MVYHNNLDSRTANFKLSTDTIRQEIGQSKANDSRKANKIQLTVHLMKPKVIDEAYVSVCTFI